MPIPGYPGLMRGLTIPKPQQAEPHVQPGSASAPSSPSATAHACGGAHLRAKPFGAKLCRGRPGPEASLQHKRRLPVEAPARCFRGISAPARARWCSAKPPRPHCAWCVAGGGLATSAGWMPATTRNLDLAIAMCDVAYLTEHWMWDAQAQCATAPSSKPAPARRAVRSRAAWMSEVEYAGRYSVLKQVEAVGRCVSL